MKSLEEIIKFRLSKSANALEDAEALMKIEHWDSVSNRLYYAAYYSVSALIYQNGEKAKTHSGLKNKFHEIFIKTNKMTEQMGEIYETLYHNRHNADYADFVIFTEEEVAPLLEETKMLLQEIKKHISI